MNIEISKERMLEMAKKLASMDFCPEQRVFYKNILRMVKADVEGRLLVLPRKVGDVVYEILEETVPNHYFYISEHKVQDVSVKAVKYAFYTRPMDDFIDTGSGSGIGFGLCEDITHAVIDEEKMTSIRKYHTITEAKNGANA